ncbi:site-specific DNA-methyltransferase [Desulfobacterales bacterium HSG16]|nr:site-specific DNA-methyltransferase [Desulfobacterales bacterium HSG16]
MATGVPKKSRSSKDNIQISYKTKTLTSDILKTLPADVRSFIDQPVDLYSNRLYYGDNLGILAHLLGDKSVCRQVRLIYIDPPFSTKSTFLSRKQKHAYEDTKSGVEFVEFLRKRLILLRELLAENGSIYLHLDEKMVFHIKLIMDEIFGSNNYRNCIIRKKCNPKNYTRKTYGNVSDFILFYTKSSKYLWNRPFEPWTEERSKEYQYIEPETGRRFMKVPIHAPGVRNGETGKPWREMLPPPGKHWQYLPAKLNEMDARGEIFWSSNGNPRRKVYLDENPGIGVQDIWMNFKDAHNQNIKITGYPTEKNPDILKRIIAASSDPGDLVLDSFSGSGTTLAVASQLKRRWIGVDNSLEAIKTTLERFKNGSRPMGDFVKKKKTVKKKPKTDRNSDKQISLFNSLNPDKKNGDKNKIHKPISDFAFISDIKKLDEIDSKVFEEWIQDGKNLPGLKSE